MKNAKRLNETHLIELVETHNIARALSRLNDGQTYCWERTKRALYHALQMESGMNRATMEKVRLALEFP